MQFLQDKLLTEHGELYESIRHRAVDCLALPINLGRSCVGFGHVLGFYMFWIAQDACGRLVFTARREFSASSESPVRIPFSLDRKDEILRAIDTVYESYLASKTNGALERMNNEAQNGKKSRRRSGGQSAEQNSCTETSDEQLRWKETVESVSKARSDPPLLAPNENARLRQCGQRMEELYDALWECLEEHFGRKKEFAVYREYVASDGVTLADLAPKYGVSRERIRQLTEICRDKANRSFFIALAENAEAAELSEQLSELLRSIDHSLPSLLALGMPEVGARKKQAIAELLLGRRIASRVIAKSVAVGTLAERQNERDERDGKLRAALDELRGQMVFPASFSVDPTVSVQSYADKRSFISMEKLEAKLRRLEGLIEIVKSPDIVYYKTQTTDHRPSFLLRLPDQTSVLVLTMPTLNLAYAYNIERCDALHRYAKENGYGYLIIDDRGSTPDELKRLALDPDLTERLDALLRERGQIVWNDILEIKLDRSVSNRELVAYVLQTGLWLTPDPFRIQRRWSL